METQTKPNNEKLLIGLIVGIISGIIVGTFIIEKLANITPTLVTVCISLFFFTIISFIIIVWFRENILKKIFGNTTNFITVKEDMSEAVEVIFTGLVDTLGLGLDKEKVKSFAPRFAKYIVWISFRGWVLRLVMSIFVVLGGLLGSVLLYNQNMLLKGQNEKIDFQISLEDATRRSALIALMSNIMDKIDNEIRECVDDSQAKILSPQLIARIAALSESFHPYRFLIEDTLIRKPYSPERGHLLEALSKSGLDSLFLIQTLYQKITFKEAYLEGRNLSNLNLVEVDLTEANLNHANLRGADLKASEFKKAKFKKADVRNTDFRVAELVGADFSNGDINGANFSGAYLMGANFERAYLQDTNPPEDSPWEFGGILQRRNEGLLYWSDFNESDVIRQRTVVNFENFNSANFSNANLNVANFKRANLRMVTFSDADLSGADFSNADIGKANFSNADLSRADFNQAIDISYEQLAKTKCLYQCKGIPPKILELLKQNNPKLFEKQPLGL